MVATSLDSDSEVQHYSTHVHYRTAVQPLIVPCQASLEL